MLQDNAMRSMTMTKKDFLNMLTNPRHTEVKLGLRALRKELRAINWKLQYRYDKKTHTFYMSLNPTAVSKVESRNVMRLLAPLASIKNTDMDVERHRHGHIYADIWLSWDG